MKGLPFLPILILALAASAAGADVSPALPSIPDRSFNLRDFGAAGDGHTLDTAALEKAIAAVNAAGGGILEVPAGSYLTGPFDLCSRLNLRLDAGATLLFSQKFEDYRLGEKKYRPLIGAKNCHDLEISGSGTLDGQGSPWWAAEWKVKRAARKAGLHDAEIGRPRMIILDGCQRVLLRGITLQNPPMYHFVPVRCEDVTVDGITIHSPADSPNTDGIDPSVSRRVLIEHCTIDTGDDCIAIKAGPKGFGPVEDVLITDCTFRHGHGCSIGSDTNSGVRRVLVRRCTFEDTDIGVRLKSRRTRGGDVQDITYTDLHMNRVGQAIVISSYYYDLPASGEHDQPKPVDADTPVWRNILVRNVVAVNGTRDAGLIIGLPEMPARDIRLENVSIEAPRGLRIAYTEGITLRDVSIRPAKGPALLVEDTVSDLKK